ncbi:hypothetical protein [Nitrosarchaeum sp.]|uniref:hypothetical protein n=1 Tax=Nitrosarchaeum sp. TaxID=2026886 RepID=UPI00247BD3EB|nr:hypothetical protein [Nitrosarchaeum sp.]MCV0411393.1 hypothetical protein [Nitrosarchaeum sp.]
MGVFFIPFSISKQLETVQLLQKISFLSQEQKNFLYNIGNNLRINVPLSEKEKHKLQDVLIKFGYMIELSK